MREGLVKGRNQGRAGIPQRPKGERGGTQRPGPGAFVDRQEAPWNARNGKPTLRRVKTL